MSLSEEELNRILKLSTEEKVTDGVSDNAENTFREELDALKKELEELERRLENASNSSKR